jgi:hypothetical protein
MLGPLKFRESAYEGRKAGFMIFTIKPCCVPSPDRSFHGEVEEDATRASMESSASDDLLLFDAWLIFQKK